MSIERRKNSRVPFNTTVDLNFTDKNYGSCETNDLSTKGVFVANISGPLVGEKCNITIHLSGSATDITLFMRGEVTRVTDEGIGLHFFETDIDSFTHLKNIIYYNNKDPDELKNEVL